MRDVWSHTVTAAIVIASICALIVGFSSGHQTIGCASAAVGLCFFAMRASLFLARDTRPAVLVPDPLPAQEPDGTTTSEAEQDESSSLVHEMLMQGRYSLLLRDQIARNLTEPQRERAQVSLEEAMTVVPAGNVLVPARPTDERPKASPVTVEAFYLDRYPVTNRQFQEFVVQGGYEQMPLWDAAIWPAVLDFVDRSGQPGPRFWENGEFRPGLEDHPVVGVSWYEAAAYARWAGKRLPTDAEWIKAGAWPVQASDETLMQRRYPWGESMDRRRTNVWDSGPSQTCSVFEFPDGVSVGGVYHLIGNVWEWTTNNFAAWDGEGRPLELPTPMKSCRGGAFDTYFDNQASCEFQSGDCPMARKHNIGFRCAIGICDLVEPVA